MLKLLFIVFSVSLLASPKAVVFDFGGVMTMQGDRDAIFQHIGYRVKRSNQRPSSFNALVEELIGVNWKMYDLVYELKRQNILVALFSNIDHRSSKVIRNAGLYNSFDLCVLSCEIGVEKPKLRAYEILLQMLDLSSQDVVFIDDRQENIEAARQMGIDAFLFQSLEQVVQELLKRGINFTLK